MKHHFLIILLLATLLSIAQSKNKSNFGIKYNPVYPSKLCVECENNIINMPADVRYGVFKSGSFVFFGMTDKEWFERLITHKNDGLALDIIRKSQFECGKDLESVSFIKGIMTKPVFLKEIKKTNAGDVNTYDILVPLCELPEDLANANDLEFNLLIIKNKELCRYMRFYDLPENKLELLNLPLYMDTLAFIQDTNVQKERQLTFHKNMEFTIPFEKNKYEYRAEDLYPLRDSLLLNYYNITSLKIRAYSSVEGSLEKNIELQEKRAESITNALESFQSIKIKREVSASENWVEFLNDIINTKYAFLKNLSKEEIKQELDKKSLKEEMEPILKNHRKAVLFLEMEKKHTYVDLSEQQMIKKFNEAVDQKNTALALELQQVIFQNVETQKYTNKVLDDLEVPEVASNISLLSNKIVFKSNQELSNELTALTSFQRLLDLDRGNLNIKYNIVVLYLSLFSQNELVIDRNKMLQHIKELEKLKYDPRMVRRMMVNYQLIMCEYLLSEKKYAAKDKALQYIFSNYKNTPYSDEDLLRLSKYFTAYNKQDWAIKMIENRVSKINISEDLLFYYINLTISDNKYTSKPAYRSILLNAYNLNSSRFCKMYDTAYSEGGISFQLLEDDYLKKNYCENCDKNIRKL